MTNKKNWIIIGIAIAAIASVITIVFYFSRGNFLYKKEASAMEVVSYPVSYFNGAIGFFARPADNNVYPGVVMVHEWWGLNDNIRNMADELAKEGYFVFAVDLYKGEVADTADHSRELVSLVDKEEAIMNMRAAAGYLRKSGASKIASLGWCFGGGKSLELALSGEPLDATVVYYGGLTTDPEELKKISWPVLGIFGAEDSFIPVGTVEAFKAALGQLNIPHEIYIYPGVGHAFANPSGGNFAPDETKDVWEKTLTFLKRTLAED